MLMEFGYVENIFIAKDIIVTNKPYVEMLPVTFEPNFLSMPTATEFWNFW